MQFIHQKYKQRSIALLLLSATALSGCSNILYSGSQAPIFSGTKSKSRTVEPALVNATLTPTPSSTTAASIEQPSNLSLRGTNSPYGSADTVKIIPAPKPVVQVARPSAVVSPVKPTAPAAKTVVQDGKNSVNSVVQNATNSAGSAVASGVQKTQQIITPSTSAVQTATTAAVASTNTAISQSAKAAASTDARIKSASDVLNNSEKTVAKAVARPVTKPLTQAKTDRLVKPAFQQSKKRLRKKPRQLPPQPAQS